MATVHIYFSGGPMDGAIQSFEDPGDDIEFPVDEGPGYTEVAVYRKVRVEAADGGVFRGKQGLWVYARIRIDEKETT